MLSFIHVKTKTQVVTSKQWTEVHGVSLLKYKLSYS